MASDKVHDITESNFETEVAQASQPVLLDFWAEWCGPCKMISPIIDEIAAEKDGAVKVGKVNVDTEQGLAARFQVRAIPTLLILKGGEVQEQIVGMTSKNDLIAKLDAVS